MNIRFIDTSVMMNLLEVPGRCADSQMIKEEFRQVLDNKEVLILPIATIIETGNHIAHINNGNSRRTIASKFGEFLRKTAEGKAPWQLYGIELDKEGVGDMSIIHAYEQYKSNTPGIGRIMIWSTDRHLQGYIEENVSETTYRRRRKL